MGGCSYCLTWQRDECYGWEQAKICGITGPNDPVRLKRKRDRAVREAQDLRLEAKRLRDETKTKVTALEARAACLEQEASEITDQLAEP